MINYESMIAIGYDYGTTTSWMATLKENGESKLASMCSDLFLCNNGNNLLFDEHALRSRGTQGAYIKSPKRFIARADWTGFEGKYGLCLRDAIGKFTANLIDRIGDCRPAEDRPAHITITIPNSYDGERMRYMRHCFERLFAERYDKFILHLLPEPIAAALHYAMHTPIPGGVEERRYLVICDIGGGTTDLATIFLHRKKVADNRYDVCFRVVATTSDSVLGGDDIDEMLFNFVLRDIHNDPTEGLSRLADQVDARKRITDSKIQLSGTEASDVELTLHDNSRKVYRLTRKMIKDELQLTALETHSHTFHERLNGLMHQLKNETEMQYKEAGFGTFDWSNVILLPVGGSMRMPLLREEFQRVFSKATMHDMATEARETYDSVVYGAMYYSMIMNHMPSNIREVKIEGRSRHPLSVAYLDNRLHSLVHANMPDGMYQTDALRPLRIEADGTFELTTLRLFLRDGDSVNANDQADYVFEINQVFQSNGRAAGDIPITLRVEMKNGELASAMIFIPAVDAEGNDFEKNVYPYNK
ncbi:hypothetical protein M2480_000568 [Parabacteroides sp. PFB2-12]|uniref:Hsp70 family protein n=1 Tax=unclassified Parabacteroides TaxID=2649774 RepID=UPI002476A5DA|nr:MULTISPECIES: Hsp70 family protein [unclassified Parabacteroides]MDH6341905.1 hypothetical protein [Parabacteroides sp. PM6-13]MDH6389603.1 hypothetical protein [Parabacteroides sp. PFB2-12]